MKNNSNNGTKAPGAKVPLTKEDYKKALESDLQVIHVLLTMIRQTPRLLDVIADEMCDIEASARSVREAKEKQMAES